MGRLIYVVGLPGAGKSSALARALGPLGKPTPGRIGVMAWAEYSPADRPRVATLGKPRATFPGTDSLALNAMPDALRAVDFWPWPMLVVGEGDRLASGQFFDKVRGIGHQLEVVLIDVPQPVAQARREARARTLGLDLQSESWVKGRATKLDNLAEWVSIVINGDRPAGEVADDLAWVIWQ